jgi:hypothetical protein
MRIPILDARFDLVDDALSEMAHRLHHIERLLMALIYQGAESMADLSQLTSAVEANSDAQQSAVQLIQELAVQIRNSSSDQGAVDALAQQLQDQAQALGAAVVANTPAQTGGSEAPPDVIDAGWDETQTEGQPGQGPEAG